MTSLWLRDREEKQRIKSFNEGKEQGLEQGRRQEKFDIAKNLLAIGTNLADIVKCTGLSLEELQSL